MPLPLQPVAWSPGPCAPSRSGSGRGLLPGALLTLLAACSGGGGGSSDSPQIALAGRLVERPDGAAPFLVDPHRGGQSSQLRLVEVSWGRLVDVHDVDAAGRPRSVPVMQDLVIDENTLSDGVDFDLEQNSVTGRTRLVVRRTLGAPDDGRGTFEDLVREVSHALPGFLPRAANEVGSIPPSLVPRNACIVLRFDDLLDDGEEQAHLLDQTVQLLAGYPPIVPEQPRIFFDQNHGGLRGARFHSTRVLLDTTVSQAEASATGTPIPLNEIGLPGSRPEAAGANAAIEIPVELDAAQGQFAVLRNLSGAPVAAAGNGPYRDEPVRALQRAFRTGNELDVNGGFLLDVEPPRILGEWPVTLDTARPRMGGEEGFEFVLGLTFQLACALRLEAGDLVTSGIHFLEVLQLSGDPDPDGSVSSVSVRSLSGRVDDPSDLLGNGSVRSPYRIEADVAEACWVRFSPPPRDPPAAGVAPDSQVTVLYSEPMNPGSFDAIDSVFVARGPASAPIAALTQVVGRVEPPADRRTTTFVPSLPFANDGNTPTYTLHLVSDDSRLPPRGVLDLAGNVLEEVPPPIEFHLDAGGPIHVNAGVTQRFEDTDELPAPNRIDIIGNVFLDLGAGLLRPRPVTRNTWLADRSIPVPSLMIPFPPGVQTPLSPLGSKLQTLWRYADLGWQVRDQSKYDMDVTGVYWSPNIGTVHSDYFPEFEMRLAHSAFIPDEQKNRFAGSLFPGSGIGNPGSTYEENILRDPQSPQVVVHPRELGYRIDPAELRVATSGTRLIPWPMNRGGGPEVSFTWRDTNAQAFGGAGGAGVPLSAEANPPLELEESRGSFYRSGSVPTIGLPLLMEFRCYPTAQGLGLNPLTILLAINTSAQPNFRAYSTGGVNTRGNLVVKNPDLEQVPTGGFNPGSSPPGRRTANAADNTFYVGALDTVTRISRGHTMWIDSTFDSPRYVPPTVLPRPSEQPLGTSVLVELRGADSVVASPQLSAFNAKGTDAYGNLRFGDEVFHGGVKTWTTDASAIDGARYFQLRYTFISNVVSNVTAELDGVALAFEPE